MCPHRFYALELARDSALHATHRGVPGNASCTTEGGGRGREEVSKGVAFCFLDTWLCPVPSTLPKWETLTSRSSLRTRPRVLAGARGPRHAEAAPGAPDSVQPRDFKGEKVTWAFHRRQKWEPVCGQKAGIRPEGLRKDNRDPERTVAIAVKSGGDGPAAPRARAPV